RLLMDVRDIWADNPYNNYSDMKLQQIQTLEKETLTAADMVLTVSESLTKFYKQKYKLNQCFTLSNGYDQNLFCVSKKMVPMSEPIQLLHAGSVTNGRDKALLDFLSRLNDMPNLKMSFTINLVGVVPLHL